jgi:hypothetical protein
MAIYTCLVTYIYLVTYICPTKFSDVGFCPTKFKLCPTKIKSDRTNVLSSQIFICSPETAMPPECDGEKTLGYWVRVLLSFQIVSPWL